MILDASDEDDDDERMRYTVAWPDEEGEGGGELCGWTTSGLSNEQDAMLERRRMYRISRGDESRSPIWWILSMEESKGTPLLGGTTLMKHRVVKM